MILRLALQRDMRKRLERMSGLLTLGIRQIKVSLSLDTLSSLFRMFKANSVTCSLTMSQ